MDKQTLEALKGSIQKWEDVLEGHVENGWKDCPLCDVYLNKLGSCNGCPISEYARDGACRNTPYKRWTEHQDVAHYTRTYKQIYCARCADIAREELEFLRGLLPKEEYFSVGDRVFMTVPSFPERGCIIARVRQIESNQHEIAVISLDNGNRWVEPFYVDDPRNIPKSLIESHFSILTSTITKKGK